MSPKAAKGRRAHGVAQGGLVANLGSHLGVEEHRHQAHESFVAIRLPPIAQRAIRALQFLHGEMCVGIPVLQVVPKVRPRVHGIVDHLGRVGCHVRRGAFAIPPLSSWRGDLGCLAKLGLHVDGAQRQHRSAIRAHATTAVGVQEFPRAVTIAATMLVVALRDL